MDGHIDLERLYDRRFSPEDQAFKERVWRILWRRVFSRYVREDDVLVDVGGGYCELANAATGRRRIVVDLNPASAARAGPGVEVRTAPGDRMTFLGDGEATVVFTSNFLEHLPDKEAVLRTLREIHRVLSPGGRIILVGPNVRLMPGTYWDFFDHHVALSDRSVVEALEMCGFEIDRVDPRFVPATTLGATPRWPWLVETYLALRPIARLLFGRQFLVVARKPGTR